MKHWEELNISNFSGPMDLLYNMVKEKKINVVDLNLIELTNEYMSYINSQQNLDIEIASEYLTMAATLLELKSRMLLPVDTELEEENDYSYEDFIEQLSRYQQIRSVADYFALKQVEYYETYSPKRSAKKFEAFKPDEEEFTLDMSIEKFANIFKRALQKQQQFLFDQEYDEMDEIEFNTIETTVLSPKEISEHILEKMKTNKLAEWTIDQLLEYDMLNIKNYISIFLAVLDLVKYQIVSLDQVDDSELYIRFTKYALENPDAINGLEVEDYE